jgi:hypothetical protein
MVLPVKVDGITCYTYLFLIINSSTQIALTCHYRLSFPDLLNAERK